MKKIILSLLLLGMVASCLLYTSCSKDEDVELKTGSDNLISSFKRTTINETSQIYVIKEMKTSEVNLKKYLEGIIYTVDLKNKTVVVTKENEAGSIVCNLVKVGTTENYKLSIIELKSGNNSKVMLRWVCAAKCALQGAAIACSDGPSPLMDIAGAAYTYACAQDC